jgi:hypothetical protein
MIGSVRRFFVAVFLIAFSPALSIAEEPSGDIELLAVDAKLPKEERLADTPREAVPTNSQQRKARPDKKVLQ